MGQSILLLIRQGWAVQTQAAEGTAQVDLNRSRIVKVQDTGRAPTERDLSKVQTKPDFYTEVCAQKAGGGRHVPAGSESMLSLESTREHTCVDLKEKTHSNTHLSLARGPRLCHEKLRKRFFKQVGI